MTYKPKRRTNEKGILVRVKSFSQKLLTLTATAFLLATTATAEKVTLRSLDGSVSMTGDLVDFDGQNYTLKTMLGQVSILADEVTCEGNCPDLVNVDFRLAGSSTIGKTLIPGIFDSFAGGFGLALKRLPSDVADVDKYSFVLPDGNPFADVDIYSFGSETAFKALLDGSAEIVMSTRKVSPDESAQLISAGLGDPTDPANQIVAALDGVVIVVAADNPVQSLTVNEMARIFAGKITNWSTLGGPNKAIHLYRRNDASGTTTDFARVVFGTSGLGFARGAQQFNDDAALVAAVAGDPDGIGFTSISAKGNARALAVRGTCGFLSEPTDFTIKTGEYPLSRRVYFYTSSVRTAARAQDRAEKMIGFLNYVQSPAAQPAIKAAGFVNQSIITFGVRHQGRRLINSILDSQNDATFKRVRKVIAELASAERLSTTFRFQTGIAQLDAQAVGDIPRLADYLRSVDLTGKQVVLAGFSDSAGTGSQNEGLSLRRAQQAAAALKAALGADAARMPIVTFGFGEVAPLGCNDSTDGRAINRRVEVWIRDKG